VQTMGQRYRFVLRRILKPAKVSHNVMLLC
jgi:hypothetical protein